MRKSTGNFTVLSGETPDSMAQYNRYNDILF